MSEANTAAPNAPERSGLIRKALRGAMIAAGVGLATGLICGLFMEPLAGALLGADAAKVFAAFPSSTMGLFFGVTSAVTAFLHTGLESTLEAYKLSHTQGHPKASSPADDFIPTPEELAKAGSRSIMAPGIDSSALIAKPPVTAADNIPTTAIMEAIHESRLQQAQEIAKIRLH